MAASDSPGHIKTDPVPKVWWPVSFEIQPISPGTPVTSKAPVTKADDKHAFVAEIARQHGGRLRRFLAARLRTAAAEAPDLVQEVYLRLLRISSPEVIRSPQAYAFTIAFHVLHEHNLASALIPESVDPVELLTDVGSGPEDDPALQAERRQRILHIDRSLRSLPRNVHAAFVLHRRFGFTVDEIAAKLGVSRGMVKKYLARAVAHCQWQEAEQGHPRDAL